jgi:hypothetical protein
LIRVADLAAAEAIADQEIRQLALQRIAELAEQGFSLSEIGEIWIVEAVTDTLADIEKHLGVPVSAYELIEEHTNGFELTFVLDQAGMGRVLLIRKAVADADLLALCQRWQGKT